MTKNKVQITTLTFRDGPQSTGMWDDYFGLVSQSLLEWKTGEEGEALSRLRRIATLVKQAGFTGAEVFWGQSFQKHMLAGISPFEAMALNREVFGPDFMLSGLGRGVNAVGFRPYGQDVIDTFVERFAQRGGVPDKKLMKLRVFDALNNLQNCFRMISAAIRNNQKAERVAANNSLPESERGDDWRHMEPVNLIHIEPALCYQPERQYNDETLYSDEYYVAYAKKLINAAEEAGGTLDSLAIKDMAGQLDPDRAARLIPKLADLGLPVYLHTHSTNYKQAVATARVAADSGIVGVETVEWPLSGGTAHASVRDVIDGMEEQFDPIDLDKLTQLEQELESLWGAKEKLLAEEGDPKAKRLDLRVDEPSRLELWKLGIPGGAMAAVMILLQKDVCTYNKTDLKNANAMFAAELDHLQQRIGWVPLVTPMADIVYTQAVVNLINGKDKIIEHRYAKMIVGLYGQHINHATGKRVAIQESASKAVLDYCRGVQNGDFAMPSFNQTYPKPVILTEQKAPPLELAEARSAFQGILTKCKIDRNSRLADEAVIMRLMEPPASKAVTERLLVNAHRDRIQALLGVLTPSLPAWDVLPAEDIEPTVTSYGGLKRAEVLVKHLLAPATKVADALPVVLSEADALHAIAPSGLDAASKRSAILRLVYGFIENEYLQLASDPSMQIEGTDLPFGPQSSLYFLQSEFDPYTREARRLLHKRWPEEHDSTRLSKAIEHGVSLEQVVPVQ
ncbi:MAG: hypothetical protein N838_32650 [Thiohalocapsa sp. PB-PSB1]|jgi:oxaloacetate decarboxylase alpha subunit|nr:MAG: hypothetical protein N838_16695 [Thiohalocapsa sp. PB-PSB1]QQO57398.1 MAG: hypothetical protein N838_32650 [Thiohalocapsa sp. PB-PSB1]